ncbi:hypothetical protein GCK72_003615 [Caenorhabditis remanei]|uniref:Uncharacterized protein n=1 Tax=Caenorhabditis remanei TaxID=31234 RepID=A0A6A5H763_CAERE|nr:hypothetical protein GCK72_003615 [Caenorhabditis remanei]KAF1763670.1 hypothetical protein GCK72_003615 [Caenorhabditis remanei]
MGSPSDEDDSDLDELVSLRPTPKRKRLLLPEKVNESSSLSFKLQKRCRDGQVSARSEDKKNRICEIVKQMGKAENNCATDIAINATQSDQLKDFQSRLKSNIDFFLEKFNSTHNFRERHEKKGFEKQILPNKAEFETFFRLAIGGEAPGKLAMQMRFCAVQCDTIRRSAASAVFFLAFLKKRELENTDVVTPVADSEGFITKQIEELSAKPIHMKAEIIVSFYQWYELLEPARASPLKLLSCNYVEARARRKENTTMITVIRGLLHFLSSVNVIEMSSFKSPTAESKLIWHSVRQASRLGTRVKGGTINQKICSLSSE